MKRVFVGLLIILSYILIVGFFFTNKMMYIKKKTDEEIIDRETNLGLYNQKDFDALHKQHFSIPSPFGYIIKGSLIAPHVTNRYIISCHGVTVNRLNSVKYMNLFLKKGWNVLIYDHRRHGESGGKTTSYGHYEKFDLQKVVQWLKQEVGKPIVLGIHGESMGAVTTLLYAGTVEDGADFYIADCPFSELEAQLLYRLKVEFKLPGFLIMPIAKPFVQLRDRYSIKAVSPINSIANIVNPVLFIHSKDDDYIPAEMSKQLYEKKQGAKKLYVADKGLHAMSYSENQKEYARVVDEFFNEIGLNP
ncbi:alpha/beta hydrolase [Metabacillus sediminilitoris]|uniref:Alpha/beta hydrolase n=1 Tax=Metabacillus sediminilitoris TaxID=2567941 RepID=A0A4S4BYV7_9BACI|nr:alpha/beta hydrolase [Metabacillus sediminilitoris]QGQ47113.1 alpha/beta fold hydrolase [Metabacillus sediminilitoris]THF80458.1 alpha/beta hydrolase [Metabacillus sediminilitoris]